MKSPSAFGPAGFFRVAAVAAMVGCMPAVYADILLTEFSEQTVPINPENGFGSFTFDDFSGAGAVTDGPSSLVLDVTDGIGGNGVFGGIGVDVGPFDSGAGAIVPIDFDPTQAYWEFRLRILSNNEATAVRVTSRDADAPDAADEHVYEFDLTTVPNDGQFHTLTKPYTDVLFTQGAFGFSAGDGVNNPGLNQVQIQSVFGSTGRLNIEVDHVQAWLIPEPGSLALLGLGALLLLRRRV